MLLINPPFSPTRLSLLRRSALPICIAFFTLVILFRLAKGGGDPTYFVLAGQQNIESSALTQDLMIMDGGYDGQFFYRYALNPFSSDISYNGRLGNHGILVDNARYRRGRLLYPLLAWMAAAGQSPLVPYTLIGINLLAFALLVWLGKKIIAHYRADPLWLYGLLLIGGFYFSTARDLADLLTCTLLAGVYLSFIQQRLGWFILISTLVLLCRESSAFYLLPAYIWWFLRDLKSVTATSFLSKKVTLFLPWLILIGWKVILQQMYPDDGFSTLDGLANHFTFPFGGMIASLQHSFSSATTPLVWSLIKVGYMGWTLALLMVCFWSVFRTTNSANFTQNATLSAPAERSWIFWSLWIGTILTLTYAFPIYTDPWSFMRVLAPTHLFCWLFLVGFKIRVPSWLVLYSGGVIATVVYFTIMVR